MLSHNTHIAVERYVYQINYYAHQQLQQKLEHTVYDLVWGWAFYIVNLVIVSNGIYFIVCPYII